MYILTIVGVFEFTPSVTSFAIDYVLIKQPIIEAIEAIISVALL